MTETATDPLRAAANASGDEALYQEIVQNALVVTGARLVSLSWYDPRDQRHRLGAVAPLTLFKRTLAAARAILPGFDPLQIRFRADVNAATRTVLIEGRALLAPFAEHAAGTVHPGVLRAATAVLGLRWTHSVPLHVSGAVAGALAFHFTERPAAARLPVAEAFAKQVALTLENARLSEALRQRADELQRSRERIVAAEERTRQEIAELLHSRVQSRLLVASHRLWQCQELVRTDPAKGAALLSELTAEFDRIREQDIREVTRLLHPSVIKVGLVPALQLLADGFEPHLQVTVTASSEVTALDHPVRNALPEALRLGVYRLVEEALANVARHARTEDALVLLELDRDASGPVLCLTIRDEGRGFDPAARTRGLGLQSVHDRIEHLGGQWKISSSRGAGTTLSVRLPIAVFDPGP